MLVNNEVGTIQPLAEVAGLVRAHASSAVLHTDAVQAVPWLDVANAAASADLVAVSAHSSAARRARVCSSRCHAGRADHRGRGPERGLRSGHIERRRAVGWRPLRATCGAADTVRAGLRERLVDGLIATIPGTVENGDCPEGCRNGTVLAGRGGGAPRGARHRGVAPPRIVVLSGATEPSHVLAAMASGRPGAGLGAL
jgi:cysteine desulfurase